MPLIDDFGIPAPAEPQQTALSDGEIDPAFDKTSVVARAKKAVKNIVTRFHAELPPQPFAVAIAWEEGNPAKSRVKVTTERDLSPEEAKALGLALRDAEMQISHTVRFRMGKVREDTRA